MKRSLLKVGTAIAVFGVVLSADRPVAAAEMAKSTATPTPVTSTPATSSREIVLDLSTRSTAAPATTAANFELWYTFGDGGRTGTSAKYTLSYTTGQATVGKGSGGVLELQRGFWQPFSTSCCQGRRGNLNLAGIIDISDLCLLVTFLTGATSSLVCYEEGNITATGIVDLADLTAFVSYLTGGGYVLPYCP